MANLIRMDLRRMARQKGFYVMLGILAGVSVFVFWLMYLAVNPEAQESAANMGIVTHGTMGGPEEIEEMSLLKIYYMTNVGDGLFSVLTGILAAIFMGTEFESGFIKNIGALYNRKAKYIFSKLLCLSLVNLIFLTVTYLSTWLINQCLGGFWTAPSSNDLLLCALGSWLLLNAISALIVLVCVISRSKAVGIGAALVIGSGMLVNALRFLLVQFGWEGILDKTLIMNLVSCHTLVEQGSVGSVLAVGGVFLILYSAIAGVVMVKKDIG